MNKNTRTALLACACAFAASTIAQAQTGTPPAQPANPPQQEKPVPANWGISPNNA